HPRLGLVVEKWPRAARQADEVGDGLGRLLLEQLVGEAAERLAALLDVELGHERAGALHALGRLLDRHGVVGDWIFGVLRERDERCEREAGDGDPGERVHGDGAPYLVTPTKSARKPGSMPCARAQPPGTSSTNCD